MRTSTRTSLLYLITGLTWILVSDLAVAALAVDGWLVQLVKGIGFVAITTVVLSVVLERREREQERMAVVLEHSEREYRALFEANPQPMWVYDLEDLCFLAVNDAAVAAYGYSRQEFLGMTIEDIRPPEDIEALHANIAQVEDGLDHAGEWRHLIKDGSLRHVEITSHVIEFDGRRAELVLVDDTTARRAAEEAVLEAKRELEAVIDTSPLAIVQLDRAAVVKRWNMAAERIFGWREDEVIGEQYPIPVDREVFERRFARLMSGEQGEAFRVKGLRKDGTELDLMLYSAPLRGTTGELEGALSVIADVTEQVHIEAELEQYREGLVMLVEERTTELHLVNERLLRATQVKSEFLANMSHELRTPLNSIIGFSGAMLQGLAGELTEEQLKQLGMVYRSGKHLLEIINDVLDLSKIEAGRMNVEAQSFGVNELVESVLETLRPQAEHQGLRLTFIPCRDGFTATTDRTKVRQILLNLIGNAIKFTEAGTVEIRVMDQGSQLRIDVEDTGPGIPAEERALIFDEFTQSKRRAGEKPQGTGLGLAISRRLARMLGGEIFVDSQTGRGSTFSLRIPRMFAGGLGPGTQAVRAQEDHDRR